LRPGPLPLSERTFRSRRSRLSSALPFSVSERPSTYKLWTDEKLRKAYEEVNGGHLSVRRAAELYGVPKSTLSDRVTGRVEFGSHSGPARYLSDAEEEELVSFLCGAARLGYARTKRDVLAVVEDVVAIKKGREVSISNGWWEGFRKRHPCLTLRTAEKLSYARSVASNVEVIDRYFDLLQQTLIDNDLDSLSQIFNCHKTG